MAAEKSLDELQKVLSITSDVAMTHAQKVQNLLWIGLNHFGMETGIFPHITGNDYTVENCVDFHEQLKPAAIFDVRATCCADTLTDAKTFGFHSLNSNNRNPPWYKKGSI